MLKDSTLWLLFALVTVLGGFGLALAFVLGNQTAQLAILGGYLSVLIGVATAGVERSATTNRLIGELRKSLQEVSKVRDTDHLSIRLARDSQIQDFYAETIDALEAVFSVTDGIFRELVKEEMNEFLHNLNNVWSSNSLLYRGELWRRPYRMILQQPDVMEYLSVAWIKSESYWQDEPGKESLIFNYELARSKRIHRLFIVPDSLWHSNQVKTLVGAHKANKIEVSLVKESGLPFELREDFGIYGQRAVGYQKTNERCETQEFELHFDQRAINIAHRRFDELLRFAIGDAELTAYLQTVSA